jgi:hypothetical protein
MSHATYYNLKPGDCIIEPLTPIGLTKHFAIYLGFINGYERFAENHKIHGVRILLAQQYFSTVNPNSVIHPFIGTEEQRDALVQRALACEGVPYSLFQFNCEHYANYVRYSKVESPQLQIGVLVAFCLGVVLSVK